MKRPNKVKAGLLIALFALPIGAFCIVGGAIVSLPIVDALLYGNPDHQWTPLRSFLSWALPLVLVVAAGVMAVVLTALIVIDRLPFGPYRLRLVPKNDPTPDIFN